MKRERAQKVLVAGRREQPCSSPSTPTLLSPLLRRQSIPLIRSAASAAIPALPSVHSFPKPTIPTGG